MACETVYIFLGHDTMLIVGDETDHASMRLLSDNATPREPVGVHG